MLAMATHASVQDRTPEFRSILAQAQKSLARQRKAGGGAAAQPLLAPARADDGAAPPPPPPPTRRQRSEFARRAAAIGRGISATMAKLQRLGELAKRKTLFDDRPVEIAELTFVIKQELAGLNHQIQQLQQSQRAAAAAGRPGGGGGGGVPAQEGEHNKNVAVLLQGRLADVTASFQAVLQVRTQNIQASRQRQENFVGDVSRQTHAERLDPRRTDSPLYHAPAASAPSAGAADVLSLEPSGSSAASPLYSDAGAPRPPTMSPSQLLVMEEGASAASSAYLHERGQAIEAIERTIHELGGIFGQLAQMVGEQAEQIQRIDANTDDVVDNVHAAQRELMKYWSRVQGNRWLVAKMFAVLMIFFLLWVLIAG